MKLKQVIEKAYGPLALLIPYDSGAIDIQASLASDVQNYASLKDLLFDHDFAKAYWGKEDICFEDGIPDCTECTFFQAAWGWHLQQAVLAEDPLEYYYLSLDSV